MSISHCSYSRVLEPHFKTKDYFMYEGTRLASFHHYNGSFENALPSKLAKSGFYYPGSGTSVICNTCNRSTQIHNLGYKSTNEILVYHRKFTSPTCTLNDGDNNFPLLTNDSVISAYYQSAIQYIQKPLFSVLKDKYIDSPAPNSSPDEDKRPTIMSNDEHCEINNPLMNMESGNQDMKHIENIGFNLPVNASRHNLRYEINRLRTFIEYRWGFGVAPAALAKAGFYCLKVYDKVRCYFCKGMLMNWIKGEDPETEHIKHFPTCLFMNDGDVGNIPINAMLPHRNRIHAMDNVLKRRRSYSKWPHSGRLSGANLADAGFFYIGGHDVVKCFCCNGVTCGWKPSEDPIIEHLRRFPQCKFAQSLNKRKTCSCPRQDEIQQT